MSEVGSEETVSAWRDGSNGELLAKAWLSSESPVAVDTPAESAPEPEPTMETEYMPRAASSGDKKVALEVEKEPPVGRRATVDDIGVRLGSKLADFSHESDRDRILQQPFGFRRWFMTHTVTEGIKQRAAAARRDRIKLQTLLDALRVEAAKLLRALGAMNGQEAIDDDALSTTYKNDENLVHRYDRLQRELNYVTALLANIDRECHVHDNNLEPGLSIANDPDNAMAELHLLESTFAVLEEIKPTHTTA